MSKPGRWVLLYQGTALHGQVPVSPRGKCGRPTLRLEDRLVKSWHQEYVGSKLVSTKDLSRDPSPVVLGQTSLRAADDLPCSVIKFRNRVLQERRTWEVSLKFEGVDGIIYHSTNNQQ
jgi:hypothetical protein